jgi:hypothetical protein
MALKPLNSVGGFSVGLTPINIIANTGEITTGTANITGNVVTGNLFVGPLSTTGNISGGNLLVSTGNVTGNLVVGNLSTTGELSATGNVTGNYILGNGALLTGIDTSQIANGTSNVQIATANGNITMSVDGTSNVVVVANTSVNVTGTVTSTGNITAPWVLGNLEGSIVSVSGNGTFGNISTGGTLSATGTANVGNLVVPGTSNIVGVATFGNAVTATGNITAPYFIGDLIGNILGNIDAAGNLTEIQFNGPGDLLAASANFKFDAGNSIFTVNGTSNITGAATFGNTVSASGNVTAPYFIGNVEATTVSASGNVNAGNVIVGTGSGGNITGANVISANTFLASAGITTQALTSNTTISATGNITGGNIITTGLTQSGTLSVTANANVGNIGATNGVFTTVAGTLSTAAQPNITSVGALSDLSVVGTATVGNVSTVGFVSATGNLTGGNVVTTGLTQTGALTVTANANIGNIDTGIITATGNITAPYFIGNFAGNLAAAGANTQVQFNDGDVIGATSGFTFDKTTNALFTGGTFSAVGTATVGNLSTTGFANVGEFAASGNAVIGGNLFVNGNLTYVNVAELAVEDPIISQGRGPNNAPLTSNDGKDRGEQMWYFNTAGSVEQSAFSGFDESVGKFFIATDVTNSNEVITVNNYGNIVLGNIEGQGTISAISTITGGNLATAGSLSVGGNANVGNLGTGGVFATTLSATGNINGANVVASAGLFGETLSTTGTATVGNVSTVGTVSATGNVTGGNLVTSNTVFTPAVTNLSGDILFSANGTSNVMTVSSGGVDIAGNISVSGNISGNFAGNITAAGSNTEILFNDGGLIGANVDFTYDKTTDTLGLGNSKISVNTVAGASGVNTLASYPVSGFTGAEFIVKGNRNDGWSMATVQAVTDGTNVDYAVFATLSLGEVTLANAGLAVDVSGGNLRLIADAANAATWVTQFRLV